MEDGDRLAGVSSGDAGNPMIIRSEDQNFTQLTERIHAAIAADDSFRDRS